ncbi:Fe-S cluster assembly protein SufB [Candidatus Gottesmanbacteria bacterium RIFCSPHIGHO2_01_FULL_42_12]|uniref:Fe-S cluster assembly protein SufB n=1 Tax=Candidatus Gottesmanbacteria bacterium RIFCSPHIGHO2_01_FULL_42_12 TaxID=1798377 RepID=A0A1F5Z3P0_9BACT|nr:MAG: Fe-S cluster assembly protein SufB [Candidatus Gottesmanbacteria bacterium RIFCSPHIGHO2_01_FULL_42_12]
MPISNPIPLEYKLGFHDEVEYAKTVSKGISPKIVQEISGTKLEPEWMLKFRLESLNRFQTINMPPWAPKTDIDFDNFTYYLSPTKKKASTWDDLPENIKKTYEKIGVPQKEREFLAGVEAQYDSEAIYGSIKNKLESQGVLFTDTDTALKLYPEYFKKYFGKLIPPTDNKFAALNSAFWSGGSFVYVPKNVKVTLPLQAYFRINAKNFGQFERTLIIADEGSEVTYQEGCSAPVYATESLHAAVVEIYVGKNATVRYVTVQNWSSDVYNLVTKRARVEENGSMQWLDVNIGSKLTMKYPSCYLVGRGAKGETLSLAIAGKGQIQDTGAKMIHIAPDTTSNILSKSISFSGGTTAFRGVVQVNSAAKGTKTKTKCDAMILDNDSGSDTYPNLQVDTKDVVATHEATVSKIEEEQIFYLMSRGLSRGEAESLIVNGFADSIIKELPIEYGMEIKRVLETEFETKQG